MQGWLSRGPLPHCYGWFQDYNPEQRWSQWNLHTCAGSRANLPRCPADMSNTGRNMRSHLVLFQAGTHCTAHLHDQFTTGTNVLNLCPCMLHSIGPAALSLAAAFFVTDGPDDKHTNKPLCTSANTPRCSSSTACLQNRHTNMSRCTGTDTPRCSSLKHILDNTMHLCTYMPSSIGQARLSFAAAP